MDDTRAAERQLIQRIVAGDTRAYEQFVRQYQRLVGHIVFKLVKDDMVREELCQDVFIKVYRNLRGFKHQSKLSTWVGRIAYNHTINYLKKKKAPVMSYEELPALESDQTGEEVVHYLAKGEVQERSPRPDLMVQADQTAELLQTHIEQLPEVYRSILTLYHQEGLPYKEIAKMLDMPEGTIKSYLFRARAKLKESLLEQYTEDELLQRADDF